MQLFQQLLTFLPVVVGAGVVVDDIEGHQSAVQLAVAHHDGHLEQLRGYLGILHAEEDLLVVGQFRLFFQVVLLFEDDLLGSVVGHECTDDTGDENHHHHTVEHVVVHQIDSWCHFQSHAYHDHGDGASSVGRCETEHHVACRLGHFEQQAGEVGSHGLSEGSEESDEEYDPQHIAAREHRPHINEHAHANQEIRDEQRIANKLDAVHQRRHMRNIPVENQSGDECAEDTLQSDGL